MQTRRRLVAEEFAGAKGEAARAKAERDKGRQKAAGDVIRTLKQEMAELGERNYGTWCNANFPGDLSRGNVRLAGPCTSICARPVRLLCAGISEDWLHQQQAAAASESAPAGDQAASREADGAGADSPPAAPQRQADPDDDGIFAGLAAADELQDATGAAALDAEAGSGGLPAQPLPAAPEPAGAKRADVYADAAYWQDDDSSAASPTFTRPAQRFAQASAVGC